jgi:hypothetical protein
VRRSRRGSSIRIFLVGSKRRDKPEEQVCDGGWYGYARHDGWLLIMLHSAEDKTVGPRCKEVRAAEDGQAILTESSQV